MSEKDIVVPSLSSDGFVADVPKQLDLLLSYFFTSQYSQSYIYYGQVASLQHLIYQAGGDDIKLRSSIQSTVVELFSRYFDTVEVVVTTDDGEDSPGNYGIVLNSTVTKDGESYLVGKAVQVVNSKVSEIADILNG